MKTIRFPNSRALGSDSEGRVNFILIGTSRVSVGYVLVDSGADYVQIPMFLANQANIDMSNATTVNVSGVGGSTTMWLTKGVDIEVEGKSISIDVLVDPNNGRSLFGRTGLVELSAHGFDPNDWHWKT